MVFGRCPDRRFPVTVTMGGGYMPDVDAVAAIHATTVETGLACLEELSCVCMGHARRSDSSIGSEDGQPNRSCI